MSRVDGIVNGKMKMQSNSPDVGKTPSESSVHLAQLMLPEHANPLGNVHGGVIMKLADEAGSLAAMRHAGMHAVTVFVESMTFDEPVAVGALLHLNAQVSWVGRSSIEVLVRVDAENPLTGHVVATNSAFFVYVALDKNGTPTLVPRLVCENERQKELVADGEKRKSARLSIRSDNN
ncbi:MAG: acyl-CoA thioesterase [Anaerolineales bacterium]